MSKEDFQFETKEKIAEALRRYRYQQEKVGSIAIVAFVILLASALFLKLIPSEKQRGVVTGIAVGAGVGSMLLAGFLMRAFRPDPRRFGVVCDKCLKSFADQNRTAAITGCCPQCGAQLVERACAEQHIRENRQE